MHVGAAELFRRDDLARCRLHEWRSGEEDRSLAANDDRFVAHRRNVRAARCARAHDDGDLCDARSGQRRLVVEDPAEVLLVGKHIGMRRQIGAAGVDEIDARQSVLPRDLLGTNVLFHGHRKVRAALHRRVVADDHAFAARDAPDAGDQPRAGDVVVVHAIGGELRQLEERTARIDQRAHALARQQLAASNVSRPGRFAAAELDFGDPLAHVRDERRHRVAIARERRIARIHFRFERRHRGSGLRGNVKLRAISRATAPRGARPATRTAHRQHGASTASRVPDDASGGRHGSRARRQAG